MFYWLHCNKHNVDYPATENCPQCKTTQHPNQCPYCNSMNPPNYLNCHHCGAPNTVTPITETPVNYETMTRERVAKRHVKWQSNPNITMKVTS